MSSKEFIVRNGASSEDDARTIKYPAGIANEAVPKQLQLLIIKCDAIQSLPFPFLSYG